MSAQVKEQPATAIQVHRAPSLVERMAAKYSVDPTKMLATLKATAFRSDKEISNETMMALLIVADQFNLNPWTKEIFAFPDKNNGIVPVVGIDGWSKIINENPQFDGLEFVDGPADDKGMPEWIECVIYRKDRQHATRAREYMAECKRSTGPWQSHPRRMLRHKSLIQCARVAFAYVGIYDEDEAQRIIDGGAAQFVREESGQVAEINKKIAAKAGATVNGESQRVDEPAATESAKTAPVATSGGPSDAEIGDRIVKANSNDDVDTALALLGSRNDPSALDLRQEADLRKAELAPK